MFTDVEGKRLTGATKIFWFSVDTNCRYSLISRYKFSVSITIFLPILRASDFPWSVCIQHVFDLHPVPCECEFVCLCVRCLFFPPASVCMFGCICLCERTSFSAIFWVVKQEGEPEPRPMLTYFNNVYSASRDLSHWNCWESWPKHALPSPPLVLCSALRKMRCCNTFIMDWWCLWASQRFEMQPNMVSVQQRYSFFPGHLFKRASTFLCNGSKEDQSPHQAKG